MLAKYGMTGIAASNIGSQTLHSWAGLHLIRPKSNEWVEKGTVKTKLKRCHNIEGKKFLIIDKISMEDKAITYDLLHAMSHIKSKEEGPESAHLPFGGMHIIACGVGTSTDCKNPNNIHSNCDR